MSVIFLDRDGVINENRSDYVKCWSEFHFLPGAREAVAKLTRAGHRIIVCTNQAGIARGSIAVETVHEIHRRMLAEIATFGGHIEKIYYCPHGKEEHCLCRKPQPGMLLRARDELSLDLNNALFIGDSITDMQAGEAAGVRCIMVMTGLGVEQLGNAHSQTNRPFTIMQSLNHAADSIVQQRAHFSYVNGIALV